MSAYRIAWKGGVDLNVTARTPITAGMVGACPAVVLVAVKTVGQARHVHINAA